MSSWLCHPQARDRASAAQHEMWEATQWHQWLLGLATVQKLQVASSAQKRLWAVLLRELQGCTLYQNNFWMGKTDQNRPTTKQNNFTDVHKLLLPCTPTMSFGSSCFFWLCRESVKAMQCFFTDCVLSRTQRTTWFEPEGAYLSSQTQDRNCSGWPKQCISQNDFVHTSHK